MKKAKDPCNIISLQHECKNPPAGFCQGHSHWRFVSGQNIVSAWGDIQTWQTVCLFNYLMAQSFIIKSQMRIPSNDTLHYFLSVKCSDDKLFKVCRLTQIPDRRTIDRRFQNLPVGTSSGRWEACSYQKEWLMTRLHQRTVLCQKQMVLHCTNPT